MKKTLLISLTSLVFSLIATTAMAQNFNGPYLGATVSYDALDLTVEGIDDLNVGMNGVAFNAVAGYNFNTADGFVFGVEVEGGAASNKASDIIDTGVELKVGEDFGANVRAGLVFSGNSLIYVKVGASRGKLKASDGVDEISDTEWGVKYGIGMEIATSDDVSLRLEVTQASFDLDDGIAIKRNQATIGLLVNF